MSNTLLLIDFSSLARPIWETAQASSAARASVATEIVNRVNALALTFPHAAICCDSGRCFRHELLPEYKGTRPERDAAMLHHFNTAAIELKRAGYPVWSMPGFEADDIIASATAQALACDGDVLIASSDKDLLQLVGPKVSVKSLVSGAVLDRAAVEAKFGVRPSQLLDYLSLCGDASDNVQGAKGIGAKTAAQLLSVHSTIADLYAALDRGEAAGVKPGSAVEKSLTEFRARWPLVRQVLSLASDVTIPFEEITVERQAPPMIEVEANIMADEDWMQADASADAASSNGKTAAFEAENAGSIPAPGAIPPATQAPPHATVTLTSTQPVTLAGQEPAPSQIETLMRAPRVEPAPTEWERQLEPRSMGEAKDLARILHDSRLFGAYGTPQGVLATMLAGREIGLPTMASLRAFHIIDGKPSLSASAIVSQVLKSGKARYFRCVERTATQATFKTLRVGDDEEPVSLTFTMEEAKLAGIKANSGWTRHPADMLVARASSKLARLVYPDVVGGFYSPEEVE